MTEQLLKDYLYHIYESNPFVGLLDMAISQMEKGCVTMTMPVESDRHTNLYHMAHGGALASLADTAMGLACCTTGKKVVTLDMSMNFIRSAEPQAAVSAVGKVVHNGSRTMVAETDIMAGDGGLVLKARGTYFVVGSFLAEE
ncbi:MAG: PaaI family thioesterase [Veillonellales bacterium]